MMLGATGKQVLNMHVSLGKKAMQGGSYVRITRIEFYGAPPIHVHTLCMFEVEAHKLTKPCSSYLHFD